MQGALRWAVRVLCVGLACLLAFLLVRYQKNERARDAHIAELRREAEIYEARLKEIQKELDAAKASIGSENRTGLILVAFQIGSAEDLERLGERPAQYGFTPAIVLDTQTPDVRSLADAAEQAGYAVVFTASPFSAEAAEAAAVLSAERAPEQDDETEEGTADETAEPSEPEPGLFLLRETYESEENLALLADVGIDGCICYYDHADFRAAHPDFPLLQYSYLKDETFSVDKRLKALSSGGEALMFVFDLTADTLTPEVMDHFLAAICGYASEHGLELTTTADACALIAANRAGTASGEAAYEQLLAERQPEIDALRAKLDEIYSNWKGESAS